MKEEKNQTKSQRLLTLIVASIITLALLFHLITFQVSRTEKAVVTTFGSPTKSIAEPGLYWKFPYPFQDYYLFDSRIQIFSSKLEQTFTSDGKNVILETFVGWSIQDPIKFLGRVGTLEDARVNLSALISTFTNSVIAQYPFDKIISEDKTGKSFESIEKRVIDLLNKGEKRFGQKTGKEIVVEGVEKSLGIKVKLFGIKKILLPESTTKEVFARMREERNRIIEDYRSQGEGQAQKIRAEADAAKEKIIIEANAEAKKTRAAGDAKAAEHYKILAKNPEFAIWLDKLHALEKSISKKTTFIIGTKTSPFDLFEQGALKVKPLKDAENKPKDPVGKPKDPVGKPKDPVGKPKDPEEKPKDPVEKPKDSVEKPKDSVEKPKDSVEKPKDSVEKPKDSVEKPKDSVEKPKDSVEKPKDSVEKPKDSVEKPKDLVEEKKERKNTDSENKDKKTEGE